jgi:pantetheine-phosphate adenylyltransferase
MINPFNTFKDSLLMHISDDSIKDLMRRWNEKTRHYHNVNHLVQIIEDIESNVWFKELSLFEKQALLVAAFFHDAIYNPKKQDNEDQSIKYFKASYTGGLPNFSKIVCDLIETTKHRKRPAKKLEKIFWDADNAKFKLGYDEMLKNENLIYKEYNFLSLKEYKEKRIKFLESCKGLFNTVVDKNIDKLVEYIIKMR